MSLRLHLGVGPYPVHPYHIGQMSKYGTDGWVDIDKHISQPGTRNYDVRALPYAPGSVDTIYTSHLLEHLSIPDVSPTLAHWRSLLKRGGAGTIHINVPDLEWMARTLLDNLAIERAGGQPPGYFNQSVTFTGNSMLQAIYGSQVHDGEFHRCGFTREALLSLLSAAGFGVFSVQQLVEAHDVGVIIVEAR